MAARQRLQTYDVPFQHALQVLPHAHYPSLRTRQKIW
jgi:hypothetical protein